MAKDKESKICFVISPIGDDESEIRRRSNQILKHIIKPVAEECGYKAVRADEISEPGIITSQVIEHILDDDLVIADLTGKNPNVFYELAVRHCAKKPIVQIIQSGEAIPFDVTTTRAIYVDHRDLDSVANCKDELIKQVRSVERDPSKADSPISATINLQSLRQSENPLEMSNAEIISMLQNIRSMIGDMVGSSRHDKVSHSIMEETFSTIAFLIQDLILTLDIPKGENPTPKQWRTARYKLNKSLDILMQLVLRSNLNPNYINEIIHMIDMAKRSYPDKYSNDEDAVFIAKNIKK